MLDDKMDESEQVDDFVRRFRRNSRMLKLDDRSNVRLFIRNVSPNLCRELFIHCDQSFDSVVEKARVIFAADEHVYGVQGSCNMIVEEVDDSETGNSLENDPETKTLVVRSDLEQVNPKLKKKWVVRITGNSS